MKNILVALALLTSAMVTPASAFVFDDGENCWKRYGFVYIYVC